MVRIAWIVLLSLGSLFARAGVLIWTSGGPETGQVTVVRFDPTAPDVVWAGTIGQGIFKSTDGGVSWTPMNKGLTKAAISAIVIDPNNSSTVWIGNSIGAIYKTTDGGSNWSSSGSGLFAGNARITSMVIDPSNPSTLYVSTTSDAVNPSLGVQKSTNGGASWSDSGSGGLGTKNVYALGIDRTNPSIIYAGGIWDNSDRPMFKSTNGGASWVSISTGLSVLSVDSIGVDPVTSGTLFISQANGMRKSTNGGTSWTSGGSGLPFSCCKAIVYERNSSTNIWAATVNDVYRTTNGGTNWTAAKIGNERVNSIDINAAGALVAGTATSGLFRRPAGASAWSDANKGFFGARIFTLVADPSSAGTLYAGTEATGIFKSIDHGRSWQRLSTDFLLSNVYAIAIDPKNSSTVYAGTFGGSGFYKSTDSGATWKVPGFLSRANAIAIDPVVTTTIYAGTDFGVSKSTTGGASFNATSTGLPSITAVVALAVDPVSTLNVYAGVQGQGLYKSTDGGATWTKKSTGISDPDVLSIAIDRLNPSNIFVATDGGGIFKTTNAGDNWGESNSGIASKFTLSVWIDPLDAHNLYAGTSTSGVYRSTDGGATWTQLGGVSPASSITSLAIEPGGNVVHAGASGGVWSFQFQPNNPQIALVAPAEGAKIVNGASLLTTISEFILDCATTGSSGSGRGHWRIDVDGALDATGCSASEMRLTKTYANGAHRITVSLRNPDDTELSPAATSSANVTITTAPSRRRSGRK